MGVVAQGNDESLGLDWIGSNDVGVASGDGGVRRGAPESAKDCDAGRLFSEKPRRNLGGKPAQIPATKT